MYLVTVTKNDEVMVCEDVFREERALELLELMTDAISKHTQLIDTTEDEFEFTTSKYLCESGSVYEISYGFSPF